MKKIVPFITSVGILCVMGTLFADIYPIPIIIKMSLWRSSVIYLILALPCIGYAFSTILDHTLTKRFLVISILVLLTGYLKCFKLYYLPFLTGFLLLVLYDHQVKNYLAFLHERFSVIFFALLSLLITYHLVYHQDSLRLLLFFGFTFFFLLTVMLFERYITKRALLKRVWVFPVMFVLMFDCAVLYHKGGPEIYYHGRIQGKPDPWAEIQCFAKKHSKKDDLFIVPPYMNDFTTYSKRAILGDWAEGANILYMDSAFAKEWLERMNDLGWKTLWGEKSGYNALSTEEIVATARKYHAVYIVTEKPKYFELPKVYENSHYILYRLPEVKEKQKNLLKGRNGHG